MVSDSTILKKKINRDNLGDIVADSTASNLIGYIHYMLTFLDPSLAKTTGLIR